MEFLTGTPSVAALAALDNRAYPEQEPATAL